MSEYYSPRPALISNPNEGIVFNYPNKAATAKINTPAVTVFQTVDPVLFSPLTDGLFEKKYKMWRTRHLMLLSDSSLQSVIVKNKKIEETHSLSVVTLRKIRISEDSAAVLEGRVGVKVFCKKDGRDTYFRCIIKPRDLEGLCGALARVSKTHNVQEFLRSSINSPQAQNDDAMSAQDLFANCNERDAPRGMSAGSAISALRAISSVRATWSMQRAVDKEDKLMTKALIRKRRGCFSRLPVLYSNDLVHGSWWFLFGSIFITATSAIVLANSYNEVIGTDDSFLSRPAFRASWALLVVSGIFCTIGSFAFVRAMNNPPMAALFTCRHFSTDELFGSWMFALATFPLVPYCLDDFVYLAMLAFSLLSFLGACLFVRGSYPVANESSKSKILACLGCCFGYRRFFIKHAATDWLVGTWLVFWATAVGTVGLFFFTLYYLAIGASSVSAFANITTFLDCVIFLIGSAYFVAGSYPRDDHEDIIDLYCEHDGIDLEVHEGSDAHASYLESWDSEGIQGEMKNMRRDESNGMLYSSTVAPAPIPIPAHYSNNGGNIHIQNTLNNINSSGGGGGGMGNGLTNNVSDVYNMKTNTNRIQTSNNPMLSSPINIDNNNNNNNNNNYSNNGRSNNNNGNPFALSVPLSVASNSNNTIYGNSNINNSDEENINRENNNTTTNNNTNNNNNNNNNNNDNDNISNSHDSDHNDRSNLIRSPGGDNGKSRSYPTDDSPRTAKL